MGKGGCNGHSSFSGPRTLTLERGGGSPRRVGAIENRPGGEMSESGGGIQASDDVCITIHCTPMLSPEYM